MIIVRMYAVIKRQGKEELIHGDFRLSQVIPVMITLLKMGARLKFVNLDSYDRDNSDMYCRLHGYHLVWYEK